MLEHLFYFIFYAFEAQILKSTSDTLAVPGGAQTFFKIQMNYRGWTRMGQVERSYE